MKKYLKSLFLIAVAACVTACTIDKLETETPSTQSKEPGYLQIGNIQVNIDTEDKSTSAEQQAATRAVTEAATSYWVFVTEKTTGTVAWQGSYADAASQKISLEPGTYVVSARQTKDGVVTPVGQDIPYYAGESEDVVITSKQTSTAKVTCKLANILTTVELSADLKAVFKSYDATSDKRLKTNVKVGTDAASNSYDFEASSTHETPKIYFRDEAGPHSTSGNTMTVVLSGDYYTGDLEDLTNGTPDESKWKAVKMTKTLTNVRAAQWRKISINISHATTGNVQFEIQVESYIYDEEIDVDVVTLYQTLNVEESIPDDPEDHPQAPGVTINGQEDLSFTIDDSSYDEGYDSWNTQLQFNVVPNDGTTVSDLYVVVNSTNAGLMSAIAEFGQSASTRAASEVHFGLYPNNVLADYWNISEDGTTIKVKRAGMDAFYQYPGTHTLSFYATDSKNRMKHTDIQVVVNKGVSAPTVVWMMDGKDVIDQQHVLTAENVATYTCKIDITSQTGLTKLEVDIVSPILTDEELASVGLATHIDLINPPATMIDPLQGLGFLPNGVSSLGGETNVSFDISSFMSILHSLYVDSGNTGSCKFHLTVGDAGGETKKTLDLYMQK